MIVNIYKNNYQYVLIKSHINNFNQYLKDLLYRQIKVHLNGYLNFMIKIIKGLLINMIYKELPKLLGCN